MKCAPIILIRIIGTHTRFMALTWATHTFGAWGALTYTFYVSHTSCETVAYGVNMEIILS